MIYQISLQKVEIKEKTVNRPKLTSKRPVAGKDVRQGYYPKQTKVFPGSLQTDIPKKQLYTTR